MLIATLPTLRGSKDFAMIERIMRHPLIDAVRYNTGGATPYPPNEVVRILNEYRERFNKKIYIDLEGRQVRVAHWSPLSHGVALLNRDFSITLPGQVHFRGMGWFEIIAAQPEERKIFFEPRGRRDTFYLGESQSAHVVAKEFRVEGPYLSDTDLDYIQAAVRYDMRAFMLSFLEEHEDLLYFDAAYLTDIGDKPVHPELILKIESVKGWEWVRKCSQKMLGDMHLMAARDDLFLGFRNKRVDVLPALGSIVQKDPDAIVASRLLSGIHTTGEVTLADMTDIVLMAQLGYKNFMLSDELTEYFEEAMTAWSSIVVPLLQKNGEK